MIEIIRTDNDPRYKTDQIGICVTHTMSQAAVAEFITRAVDLYGAAWVASLLPGDAVPGSLGYMVSVDGAQAPSMTHDSFARARNEAYRILNTGRAPATARVLSVVKILKSRAQTVVTEGG